MKEKNYWLSWYANAGPWELRWPWWVSGYRYVADPAAEDGEREEPTVVAAVRASSEIHAKKIILLAHDSFPDELEWRFIEERPEDWEPFTDRFPRADWMGWPHLDVNQ